jgi:hypothetical protein
MRRWDKSAVDLLAVYCPDVDSCFYLDPAEFGESVTLRIRPARNGQGIGVRLAAAFRAVPAKP